MKYKEIKIGSLFEIKSNPQLNKNCFVFSDNGKYPYFTRTVTNNGILGYVDYLDDIHMIKGGCISVGMLEMKFFYMEKDFYAGQFTKRLIPKFKSFNRNIALYFTILLNEKSIRLKGYLVRDFEKILLQDTLNLPIKSDESVDYDFMERYIHDIEIEYIHNIYTILTESNFNDIYLNEIEKQVLNDYDNGKIKMKRFIIGDLFFKIKTNKLNYSLSDLPKKASYEFDLPATTSTTNNRGISCYVKRNEATVINNCLLVLSNGDAGYIYYHKNDFTILQDTYAIKYKGRELNKNQYLYFESVMNEKVKPNFSYNNKATWDRVRQIEIFLPVKNNESIDYDFMENYISAVEKETIKSIIDWNNKKTKNFK